MMSLPLNEQAHLDDVIQGEGELAQVASLLQSEIEAVSESVEIFKSQVATTETQGTQALALSGYLIQLVSDPEEISAADLNAAPAGTLQRTFQAELRTAADGSIHEWCSLAPIVTPGGTFADGDIGPPSLAYVPVFSGGVVEVTLIFDTDGGVTKTYAPGDQATCEVKVSGADTLLGYPVAPVTKTYDVI